MSGTRALAQYAKSNNLSRGQLAARLGVSEGFLSLLMHGKRFAGLALALRIEQRTDGAVRAASLINPSAKRDVAAARFISRSARSAARQTTDRPSKD